MDMGILIQNNRESKGRMMFFKVVNHNLRDKKREVYLMSIFEDQRPKWENCLEPSDDITSYDRTYKLIKDRLLKAVIERSRRLTQGGGEGDVSAFTLNLEGDEWEDPDGDISNSFSKLKESRRKSRVGNGPKNP
jgi:hypothetical protein